MTSELERASALVDELETKRAQHVAKAEKLAAERDEIALGAFTGNGKQLYHRQKQWQETVLYNFCSQPDWHTEGRVVMAVRGVAMEMGAMRKEVLGGEGRRRTARRTTR